MTIKVIAILPVSCFNIWEQEFFIPKNDRAVLCHKHLFEKGYTPNYTTEVFRVKKGKLSNPRTYLLEDMDGKPIEGRFYEQELLKTSYPNVYLLEKVIQKKGNKYLVKYVGFEKNFWINKKDLLELQ